MDHNARSGKMTLDAIARLIDHTLLKPDARRADLEALCREAAEFRFACAMVNSANVAFCAVALEGTGIPVGTTVGFPLGASGADAKVAEAAEALVAGAREFDMVMNLGAFKDGDYRTVEEEIRAVVRATEGHCVKVIIETCLLTDEEKIAACRLVESAGAAFVKTSTGFSTCGATVEDVRLLRKSIGPGMKVKASGGIRTAAQATAMIEAGAARIGTSAGVAIIRECEGGDH